MVITIGSISIKTDCKVRVMSKKVNKGIMYRFDGRMSTVVKVVDECIYKLRAEKVAIDYGVDRFGCYILVEQ